MVVAEETLARAKKSDRRAIEEILAASYPSVYRMAHALTGRAGAARQVTAVIMHRSLRVLPHWRQGTIPENWFYHHTLLTARATGGQPSDPKQDLLVSAAGAPASENATYIAFVRALRSLPRQQMEAFVLNHGEKLNARLLGVAMDCSTQAAATHLQAATAALEAVSGGQFPALASALESAYAAMAPPADSVLPTIRKRIAATVWSRRLRRLVRRLILLAIVAALAWLGWRYRSELLQWWTTLREKQQSTTKSTQ